ncbi:uncharacterized protein [Misgurnus anguillicaudatus]|uniref:uncharacterized protein isoform X5 n=1 Tax=Misgurnus anguillicaudatus TaxID=75329 RepID=UPI003CCF2624
MTSDCPICKKTYSQLSERHPAAAPQTHSSLDTSGWTTYVISVSSFPYRIQFSKFTRQDVSGEFAHERCLDYSFVDPWALHAVCFETTTTRNLVTGLQISSLEFRHRAHYAWLESVVNVRKLPQAVRDMCVPYKIIECRNCKCFFKNWVGYCGNGRRGELRGFYSDTEFLEHCPDCQF